MLIPKYLLAGALPCNQLQGRHSKWLFSVRLHPLRRQRKWSRLCILDTILPLVSSKSAGPGPGVAPDQQSTALNEEGGINVQPLKMISSHPIIASRFHQFTVWERTCWRGRKCELWHRCANISLSSYLRLYLFRSCAPAALNIGGGRQRCRCWWGNQ